MKTLLDRLDKRFFTQVSNVNLVFLRFFACFLAITLLCALFGDIVNIYASKGYISHDILKVVEFDFEPRLDWMTIPMEKYGGISEILGIKICLIACMLILLLLGLGVKTRLTAACALFLWTMILNSSKPFQYGVDYFISSALFYCLVFPTEGSLAVLFSKRKTAKQVFVIYTMVLQAHLSIVYCFNGLAKSLGQTWWSGDGIWRAINMGDNPMTVHFVAQYPIISIASSYLILFFEVLHPFLVLFYPTRFMALIVILGMHVFIGVFMNLYFFSAIMIILNISAYWTTISRLLMQINYAKMPMLFLLT